MFRLTDDQRSAVNERMALGEDEILARTLRREKPHLVDDFSEDALIAEIRAARHAATELGLTEAGLRGRFIRIHCLLTRGFWQVPAARAVLTAPTGTPAIRFGDYCATLKAAAAEAGCRDEIWW